MSRLNTILKENSELKNELEGIIGLIRENEVKHQGFKIVEYAFLMSRKLSDIEERPLSYLKEIFSLDKIYLCINKDIFNFEDFDNTQEYQHIKFYNTNVFKYFFLKKRPYIGSNKVNLISEFDLYSEMGSYLISPIFENDKLVGSLNIYSKSIDRFSDDFSGTVSFDFIKELSFKAGISLRKIYDSEFIRMKSKIDDLTGCYNKNGLYENLEIFLNRHRRYAQPFFFIMFDLDNFKIVNDTLGHLVGDEFLRRVGKGLKEKFRKSDIIGRFGGDEFFMLIPKKGADEAKIIHSKVTDLLEDLSNEFDLEKLVTASAGCVEMGAEKEPIPLVDLIKLADDMLYKSKKESKGSISIA
jgi:diguanylate cyclase (GGDEF)-like protein